ncbi:hypothetical protein CWI37_0134p0040 [Hamiltosporidium tvaerminnensis]|uniref:Uncharacterized protein n=1 Tax=Hamiltosporidium tvaerminnensis TaxID=1176355 RepID=A0A4Q9L8I9_9MICR|nr:hypothetical protein CWI37_0197p0040 [Hamiltosporidium tvaerminnensis]TBU04447.1 hypothetical protein CWI37_0134p0040 [Hamiltosporidium tvaerminnensis]
MIGYIFTYLIIFYTEIYICTSEYKNKRCVLLSYDDIVLLCRLTHNRVEEVNGLDVTDSNTEVAEKSGFRGNKTILKIVTGCALLIKSKRFKSKGCKEKMCSVIPIEKFRKTSFFKKFSTRRVQKCSSDTLYCSKCSTSIESKEKQNFNYFSGERTFYQQDNFISEIEIKVSSDIILSENYKIEFGKIIFIFKTFDKVDDSEKILVLNRNKKIFVPFKEFEVLIIYDRFCLINNKKN